MDKIFDTDGITNANCTIDFESKSNELKMSLEEKYSKFDSYFEKIYKARIKEYDFVPRRQDNGKRNWTNNNVASIKNILKLAVDCKPQCTKELIEKIKCTSWIIAVHCMIKGTIVWSETNTHTM